MGFFDSLFGGGNKSNPANAASPYFNQIQGASLPYLSNIPQQMEKYQQPYVNYGHGALPQLQEQYGSLMNNPGSKLNEIGSQFHQSPGFKFALEQALGSLGRRENAEGMYQTPEHEQRAMELATQLGNQDYYHWLGGANDLYNQGLSGEQGLASGGLQAGGQLGEGALRTGMSMSDLISSALAQQGTLAFRGQQEKNSQNNSLWGGIGKTAGVLGALSAFTPWGSVGQVVGNGVNSALNPQSRGGA